MKRFHEVHTCWSVCDRRKKISIKEKNKTYLGINEQEKIIAQYHIDAKETNTETVKCDYAIYIYDDNDQLKDEDRLIFIELKGTNISHGIQQIAQSLKDWVIDHNTYPRKIDARVIASGSRNPRYYSQDMVRLNKQLHKYGGGKVIIGSNAKFEEYL